MRVVPSQQKKMLFVGIGNIGEDYQHTRHNIGFDILEKWSERHDATWEADRLCTKSEILTRGKQIVCIKPTTYVNLSGKAVSYWLKKTASTMNQLLVIVDDISLPLGKVRLRRAGGNGGHNGLHNIQQLLGSTNYARMRCGIGNNFSQGRQTEYVLGAWTLSEKKAVQHLIMKGTEALNIVTKMGIEQAMNAINTPDKS